MQSVNISASHLMFITLINLLLLAYDKVATNNVLFLVSVVNMTPNPNSCQNLDDVACSRIVSADPSICVDACVAKVCSGSCGGCCKFTLNMLVHVNGSLLK